VKEAVSIVPPGKLVCGLVLPVVAQSRLISAPWEAACGTEELRRAAEACDRSGFFYVAVCDHVCIPRAKVEAMSTTWYDPVATLGFLAALTRSVRLLSYVYVLPYRHPLATAKAFATLDALSGGRVILGVGAGHLEEEFAALGVEFRGRGKRLEEAIDLVAAALRDEFPDHHGERWQVSGMGVGPRPSQQPRPPIWVGGSSRAALRRAAERGDGWLPQGTPRERLAEDIAFLREHRARVRGAAPIDVGANAERVYVGTPPFETGPGVRTGSAAELAEPLRELAAIGVGHVGVRFRARSIEEYVDQIEAFAAEVMPLLNH
jgi:probable F420-dependent oxidoreductase